MTNSNIEFIQNKDVSIMNENGGLMYLLIFSTNKSCEILCQHRSSMVQFTQSAGRHTMLLQCANMYARTGHSNANYNTKYNFCSLDFQH